ncbi:hypothetical protein Rs2_50546 [Raphanus sativus]|nr:hypothetical protein Rs2_50546 [Raphanus sativus]
MTTPLDTCEDLRRKEDTSQHHHVVTAKASPPPEKAPNASPGDRNTARTRIRPTQFLLFAWPRSNRDLQRATPEISTRATEVPLFTPIASFPKEIKGEAKPNHHRATIGTPRNPPIPPYRESIRRRGKKSDRSP